MKGCKGKPEKAGVAIFVSDKIHFEMETVIRPRIATAILREKKIWSNHATCYQTILQGCSNQNSMVPA